MASVMSVEAVLGYLAKRNPRRPGSIVELGIMAVTVLGVLILIALEAIKYGRAKDGR